MHPFRQLDLDLKSRSCFPTPPQSYIRVFVDPKSLPYIDGTELDFAREGLNEGFKFQLFCAMEGGELGAAHAGWRGLLAGVLEATIARMQAPSSSLLAWLGPCIGPASYEVGEEVRNAFVDTDAGAVECFVSTRPGHWLCDLAGLARRRLAQVGVERVYGGGFDTLTDQRFYSYRRDGAHSGRFATLIWLS